MGAASPSGAAPNPQSDYHLREAIIWHRKLVDMVEALKKFVDRYNRGILDLQLWEEFGRKFHKIANPDLCPCNRK